MLFGIILFRLWFLQILSGQQFVAQANDNRLRTVKIVAPRGAILDRHGEVIVENRPGLAVGIRLMDVPDGELDLTVKRLAKVLQDEAGQGSGSSSVEPTAICTLRAAGPAHRSPASTSSSSRRT